MPAFQTQTIRDLTRIYISLSVTLSAFAAGVLASGRISWQLLIPSVGVFLLACGASALNQVQEKDRDAIMERTKNRPLPSGKITVTHAVQAAVLLILAGFALLLSGGFLVCVILGILNIAWYNGFYTWLKKRSAFAVVPGALSGVIPVFMGWSAAGGSLTDHHALLLALFLFLWQIPHFWLLMLKYGDEYRLAGFPVMTDIFSLPQFRNIIMAWIVCATGTTLMLVYSGFWIQFIPKIIILLVNLIILVFFFSQLYFRKYPNYKMLFVGMNIFLVLVLGIIIIEQIVR